MARDCIRDGGALAAAAACRRDGEHASRDRRTARRRSADGHPWPSQPPLAAGGLRGAASGLKLTAAPYAVALCAALVSRRAPPAVNLRAAAWYAAGGIAGLVATHGPWSYALWTHFRHPLFPYANGFFRSPWWEFHRVLPRHFGAHAAGDWVTPPFGMLAPQPGIVSE